MAQGTDPCKHTAIRQPALSALGVLYGKSFRVSQEPAALITGCAVTSIFPNRAKTYQPGREGSGAETAAMQGEKDNCVDKGEQQAPRRAAHPLIPPPPHPEAFSDVLMTHQWALVLDPASPRLNLGSAA